MIIVKSYTLFGEIVKKFDNAKDALKYIKINLENKVPFGVFM